MKFTKIDKFSFWLYGVSWAIATAFIALVNFTPLLSGKPLAASTNRAIFGTIGMSLIFFLIFGLVVWTDYRQRNRVSRCSHSRAITRTTCSNCGTTIYEKVSSL